jgi:hypothetical protein
VTPGYAAALAAMPYEEDIMTGSRAYLDTHVRNGTERAGPPAALPADVT